MSLAAYLEKHFVGRAAFAALAGIGGERLGRLLALGAIPAPSYTCDGTAIASAVFGRIPIDEPLVGEYFRPECARWARIADQAPAGAERDAVVDVLAAEWRAALADHGVPAGEAEAKIAGWLPYFFDGTFGLCVADPSNGAAIARKELLQARLGALTGGGAVADPPGIGKRLVDDLRPRVEATA